MRIAGVVLALGLFFSFAAEAAKLSPADIERLEAGEVIVVARSLDEEGAVAARAMAVLDFPPEAVWKHLDDCGNYAKFMPRTSKSVELLREGKKVVCRIEIDMPFPLGDLWSETDARHDSPAAHTYRRRWKMPEGKGTYRQNKGSWVISPWQGDLKRCLVKYQIKVQPEGKVPTAFLKEAQKRSLPGMMKALKKRTATAK